MIRLVREIGTGPIGIENGARIHITAAMTADIVIIRLDNLFSLTLFTLFMRKPHFFYHCNIFFHTVAHGCEQVAC